MAPRASQLRELSNEKCPDGRYIFAVPVSIDWMQINRMEKTSMCEEDDILSLIPRFQNAVLRPAGSVRKDRDIAHIQVAAVNDEETLAARGYTTKVFRLLLPRLRRKRRGTSHDWRPLYDPA